MNVWANESMRKREKGDAAHMWQRKKFLGKSGEWMNEWMDGGEFVCEKVGAEM